MAIISKNYINNSNASGLLTTDAEGRTVDVTEHNGSTKGLKLGGTLVTATAAELNLLDGATVILTDVVQDTSPQLGGDLDLNGNQITSPDTTDYIDIPNGSITLNTNSTSRVDITDSGVRLGGANARVTTILDEDNMASDSSTSLATQQSIKAYADTKLASLSGNMAGDINLNGNQLTSPDGTDLIDIPNGKVELQTNSTARLTVNDSGIMVNALTLNDTSNNELLKFTATASAVNELTVTNNSTGNNPSISATGGDTNIGIDFKAKGDSGRYQFYDADGLIGFDIRSNPSGTGGSGVGFWPGNSGTGQNPEFFATGTDHGISFRIAGTGVYAFHASTSSPAKIYLYEDEDNGTNRIGIQAPDSIGTSYTYVLPSTDGTNTQVLQTNGAGVLSFAARTVALTARWAVGAPATDKYIVVPWNCTLTNVYTVMDAVLTGSNNTMFFKNHAGSTMGTSTITYTVSGAADGDIDSCTPSTNNTFTAGQRLQMVDNGEASNTTTATVTFLFTITG